MMTMIYDLTNRNNIPQCPGIYTFKDEEGQVLYIGKSVNLKSRISSYFRIKSHGEGSEKLLRMKRFITIIEVTPTNTEFEAEWVEQQLIERHRPQYNQQMKSRNRHGYLKLVMGEGLWKWRIETLNEKTEGFHIGPFRHPKSVKDRLEALRHFDWLNDWRYQPVPIVYDRNQLKERIKWLQEIFGNEISFRTWVDQLKKIRDELAEKLIFEEAARLQNVIEGVAVVGDALRRNHLIYGDENPFMIIKNGKIRYGYCIDRERIFRLEWLTDEGAEVRSIVNFGHEIYKWKVNPQKYGEFGMWEITNLDQEMIINRHFLKKEGQIIGCFL